MVLGQAPAAETVICPASILPGVSDHGFWAVQSLVTEPGPAAAAIDQLPSDLGALRAASRQLVFHYWADGDYAANGIAPERISEIDTRYAAAMSWIQAIYVPLIVHFLAWHEVRRTVGRIVSISVSSLESGVLRNSAAMKVQALTLPA